MVTIPIGHAMDDAQASSYRKTSSYLVQHHLTIAVVTVAWLSLLTAVVFSLLAHRSSVAWPSLAHTICKHTLQNACLAESRIEQPAAAANTIVNAAFDRVRIARKWNKRKPNAHPKRKHAITHTKVERQNGSRTNNQRLRSPENRRPHKKLVSRVPPDRTILRLNIARAVRAAV